jgi:hypothetical protein
LQRAQRKARERGHLCPETQLKLRAESHGLSWQSFVRLTTPLIIRLKVVAGITARFPPALTTSNINQAVGESSVPILAQESLCDHSVCVVSREEAY